VASSVIGGEITLGLVQVSPKTSRTSTKTQNPPKTTKNSRKLQQKHKKTIVRLKGDPKSFKKASKTTTMKLEMLQKQRNLATWPKTAQI